MTTTFEYRAALFDRPASPLRVERLTMPQLHPREVLVRVACCTLCGSDFHTYGGRRGAASPSILGHEVTGTVVDFAPGDGAIVAYHGVRLERGDRVTWSIAVSCRECAICRAGLPQKCQTVFKYGHEAFAPGVSPSGGLSQYCVLRPGTAIFRVPAELSDGVAATANCAAATVMAAIRTAGSLAGSTVLIQGAGMLGLTAAAVARERGATVIVADPDGIRLRNAMAFGAAYALNCTRDLQHIIGGRGVDVAFEFSGDPVAVEDAIPLLGVGA